MFCNKNVEDDIEDGVRQGKQELGKLASSKKQKKEKEDGGKEEIEITKCEQQAVKKEGDPERVEHEKKIIWVDKTHVLWQVRRGRKKKKKKKNEIEL